MPQIADIELAGNPYTLIPGSYRRSSDGLPEGRTGRVVINDFVGGQRRALQLERDTSWDGSGVGPAFFGQGVEPWPWSGTHVDSIVQPVSNTQRVHALTVGNHVYLGIGRYLYRSVGLDTTSWGSLTQVADLGAGQVISSLAWYGGKIAIATGNGLDIRLIDTLTLAVTTLASGLKGSWIVGYANRLIAADPTPGNESVLKLTTGGGVDTRELDSPVTNMAIHGGRAVIATRSALWLLGGRADPATGKWIGEPDPLFSHGAWSETDDFLFLASFGGKLYTWLNGQVMEWNPNGGSTKQGWRSTGLEGRTCYGGTIAGNVLVVSLRNRAGVYEVWAFDGTGWWLMKSTTAAARIWPVHLAGAGNIDLVAFRNGDSAVAYDIYRMIHRDPVYHGYASSGTFVTSLLDAGQRDADKAWRALGAVFATPVVRGNAASTDPVSLTLRYSVDGGTTWIIADSLTTADPEDRTIVLRADLTSAAALSRFLQIQVEWTSVSDWAPVLTGVWAEYAIFDQPARRRRWSLQIMAQERVIQRDGSLAVRSGREQIEALWTAWQSGQSVSFADIDFDTEPVTRQVRIVDIEEHVSKPSDASRWGESSVRLGLVEL